MSMLELLTQTSVRFLREGDRIPPELKVGFDLLGKLDREWIWVVEEAGSIRGVLVAAPCHGVAMIYRLALLPGTPVKHLILLLRTFLADLRNRGIEGYLTFLDPESKIQAKLQRVIERAGGKQVLAPHVVMAARLPREGI